MWTVDIALPWTCKPHAETQAYHHNTARSTGYSPSFVSYLITSNDLALYIEPSRADKRLADQPYYKVQAFNRRPSICLRV